MCVRSLQHEVTRTHVKDTVANSLLVNPITFHTPTDFLLAFVIRVFQCVQTCYLQIMSLLVIALL